MYVKKNNAEANRLQHWDDIRQRRACMCCTTSKKFQYRTPTSIEDTEGEKSFRRKYLDEESSDIEGAHANHLTDEYLGPSCNTLANSGQLIKRTAKLWEDRDFPPHHIPDLSFGIEWKRPTQITRDAEFIVGGISRLDICQGVIADCWLLNSLSTLAMHKSLIERVIVQGQRIQSPSYEGKFSAQFWRFGKWIKVTVDDRLPVVAGSDELAMCMSCVKSEFWSAMVEKCYAKIFKGYECINYGWSGDAMVDLTGGTFLSPLIKPGDADFKHKFQMWIKMGSLIACSIGAEHPDISGGESLVRGHGYAVTGGCEIKYGGRKLLLVRVRNPHGSEMEWKGDWSDQSSKWDRVDMDIKKKLSLMKQHDGEFWMSYEDFSRHFSDLDVLPLSLSRYYGLGIGYYFSRKDYSHCLPTRGGWITHQATYKNNHRYLIRVGKGRDPAHQKYQVFISLMQKDQRVQGKQYSQIGWAVFHPGAEAQIKAGQVPTPLHESTYPEKREVAEHLSLSPGTYLVIPSSFEPCVTLPFLLRIWIETKGRPQQLVEEQLDCSPYLMNDEAIKTRFRELRDPETLLISVDRMSQLLNEEVTQGISGFGRYTKELCHSLMKSADHHQDGGLDLDEFMDLLDQLETYKNLYSKYEDCESGGVNVQKLRCAVKDLGYIVDADIHDKMETRYCNLGTNHISPSDFMLCLSRLVAAFKVISMNERDGDGNVVLSPQDYLHHAINA